MPRCWSSMADVAIRRRAANRRRSGPLWSAFSVANGMHTQRVVEKAADAVAVFAAKEAIVSSVPGVRDDPQLLGLTRRVIKPPDHPRRHDRVLCAADDQDRPR